MKRWTLAALMLGSLAMVVRADGPSTRPAAAPDLPAPPPHYWLGDGSNRAGMRGEEWSEEVVNFMRTNSPVRFGVIESLPEGTRKRTMRLIATRSYWNYERQRNQDPKLAEITLSRIKLEDQVFDLAQQIRTSDSSKRDELRDKLKKAIGELIDTNIKEREKRISNLKIELQDEQDRLTADKNRRDQTVESRLNAYLTGIHESQPERTTEPSDTTRPSE